MPIPQDIRSVARPKNTIVIAYGKDKNLHAVHGRTLALPETNRKLEEIRKEMLSDPGWGRRFLKSGPSVIKEYAGGIPLVIVSADEELSRDRDIDLGGVTALDILFFGGGKCPIIQLISGQDGRLSVKLEEGAMEVCTRSIVRMETILKKQH